MENEHVSTLGATSGERVNPTSPPNANGSATKQSNLSTEQSEKDEESRTNATELNPQAEQVPPDPPEPPDKKTKRDEKEQIQEKEKGKEGEYSDFPPDVLGSQIVIPSLSDLATPSAVIPRRNLNERPDPDASRFPSDCLGSQIMIPSLSDLAEKQINPTGVSLVDPEYGENQNTQEKEEAIESSQSPRGATGENRNIKGKNAMKQKQEERKRNAEKREQIKKAQSDKLEAFNRLFSGESNWAIYLTIKTETQINITKLEQKLLNIYPSEEMMVRRCYGKDNQYIVKTTSKSQSETYLKIKKLNGQNVEVAKHSELNSIWGSILIMEQGDNDEEVYLDIIKHRCSNFKVEEVKLVTIKRNEKDLTILKIKFNGEKLPTTINIEGRVKEVRPFIPKPAQCYACLKYGHYSDKCRSNITRCYKCGSTDHDPREVECKNNEKCFNCGGEHHARSNRCPFYEYYSQIKLLQIRTGLSVREAKMVLRSKNIQDPYEKITYNQATRTNPTSPARMTKEAPKKPEDSPLRNRYEALQQVDDAWDEPTEVTGKRTRDKTSPQAQRIAPQKKSKYRSVSPSNTPRNDQKTPPRREEEETNDARGEPTHMEVEQENQSEEIHRISTVVNMAKPTKGFWADMPYESDLSQTQFHSTNPSNENDIQGVMNEVEKYKRTLKEERQRTNQQEESISDSLPSIKQDKDKKEKDETKEKQKEPREQEKREDKRHHEECSCEACMYEDVRELKYRNDRNISLVLDVYMGKPPLKDLKRHPSDCLCGGHLRSKLKDKRIPYSKIIDEIRRNKYRPPK